MLRRTVNSRLMKLAVAPMVSETFPPFRRISTNNISLAAQPVVN